MAKKLTGMPKKAWDAFSRLVRVQDCLATTGFPFVGVCVTCDQRFHIRSLQAGHCFPGRTNGVLFHKELVNAQCGYCNETCHGRPKRYKERMKAKYGEEQFEQWEFESRLLIHDRDMDFEGRVERYNAELKEILTPLGYSSWKNLLGEER